MSKSLHILYPRRLRVVRQDAQGNTVRTEARRADDWRPVVTPQRGLVALLDRLIEASDNPAAAAGMVIFILGAMVVFSCLG